MARAIGDRIGEGADHDDLTSASELVQVSPVAWVDVADPIELPGRDRVEADGLHSAEGKDASAAGSDPPG